MTRVALALLSVGTLSCGQDYGDPCTLGVYGLTVEITNAATAQPICDATVTATDGAHSEVLFQTSCTYVGAVNRPGIYTVRAEKPAFVPTEVRGVEVATGNPNCLVKGVRLAMQLVPEG